MKKTIIFSVLAIALVAAILAGCTDTDVVLKYSPTSFNDIIKKDPALVNSDTSDNYFKFAFDGITTLKVSKDFKATGKEDILLETPLKPFTDAGLDVSRLGEGYKTDGDKLYLTGDYGDGTGAKATITDALFEAVKNDRKNLTYHQSLDHYGVKLLKGKFEWAKDYTKNDKDIVFVIAAKPLADLGVNVQKIDGWAFMTIQDADGTNVDILAKPYDLK